MKILMMLLREINLISPKLKETLEEAGVKYVMSSWIDMHGIPKTKPVPMSDFEELCIGKGPQFAVHSVFFCSRTYSCGL